MTKSTSAGTPSSSMTGKETLAYCTSCKMDLAHTIVAMQGDRVVRAQCKTCKKEHAYKAPKGVTDPTQAPKAASKKSKKASGEKVEDRTTIEVEWQKLMNQHKNAPIKSYSPKSSFDLGTKIKHASFGEGIVGRLIHPNKIEVIFQTDLRILIHAGGISHIR